MAKFWLQYGSFILVLLASFQFYLAYLTFSDSDWLMVAVHLFAGLVALGVGLWIARLRWLAKKVQKWMLIVGVFGVISILLSGPMMVGCKSEEEKLLEPIKVSVAKGQYIEPAEAKGKIDVGKAKVSERGLEIGAFEFEVEVTNKTNRILEYAELAYSVYTEKGPEVENSTQGTKIYNLAPGETRTLRSRSGIVGLGILFKKITKFEYTLQNIKFSGESASAPPKEEKPTSAAPADFDSWAEAAISWAIDKRGSEEWYNYCLRFVANAFRQRGPEPEGEWNSAWEASQNLRLYDEEPQLAPRGSLIFFGKTEDNQYGHVGIYLGDGRIIHAYGIVKTNTIHEAEGLPKVGHYIGWAYPPEKWRPVPAENSKGLAPEEVVMCWLNLLKEGKFSEAEELYTPDGKEDIEIAGGLEKVWKANQIEKIEIIRTEYEGPRYEANEAHVYIIFYLTDGTKVRDKHFNFYKIDNQWKIDDLYGCYPGLD